MPRDAAEAPQLFVCEASEHRARLTIAPGECTVLGIYGPLCQFARTLPSSTAPSRRPTSVVELIVTDPCYWSPELPHGYRLDYRLPGSTDIQHQPIGLRRWERRHDDLFLERKRVVLRGGMTDVTHDVDWSQWRDRSLAMCISWPVSKATLEAASAMGVPLVVRCDDPNPAALRTLAAQPAVLVVVLDPFPNSQPLPSGPLYAAVLRDTVVPTDADCLLIDRNASSDCWQSALQSGLPMIAFDSGPNRQFAAREIRSACESMQAALAPQSRLAGYLVNLP